MPTAWSCCCHIPATLHMSIYQSLRCVNMLLMSRFAIERVCMCPDVYMCDIWWYQVLLRCQWRVALHINVLFVYKCEFGCLAAYVQSEWGKCIETLDIIPIYSYHDAVMHNTLCRYTKTVIRMFRAGPSIERCCTLMTSSKLHCHIKENGKYEMSWLDIWIREEPQHPHACIHSRLPVVTLHNRTPPVFPIGTCNPPSKEEWMGVCPIFAKWQLRYNESLSSSCFFLYSNNTHSI